MAARNGLINKRRYTHMLKIARRIAHALKGSEKNYLVTIAVSGLLVQTPVQAPDHAHALRQAEYIASGGCVVSCVPA